MQIASAQSDRLWLCCSELRDAKLKSLILRPLEAVGSFVGCRPQPLRVHMITRRDAWQWERLYGSQDNRAPLGQKNLSSTTLGMFGIQIKQ